MEENASFVAAFHACAPFAPSAAFAEAVAIVLRAFLGSEVVVVVAAALVQPRVGDHRHRETDRETGLGLGLDHVRDLDLALACRAWKSAS